MGHDEEFAEDEWEDNGGVVLESDFDPFEDMPEAEAAALLEWLHPDAEQVARVTHGSDRD